MKYLINYDYNAFLYKVLNFKYLTRRFLIEIFDN